jgi:hypothetical protein
MSSSEDVFCGLPDPLKESGDQVAVEDETPLPDDLETDAVMPASVAYVKRMMSLHRRSCPAFKQLRKWAMIASFLLGIILTLNGLGLFFGKSWLQKAVRDSVQAVLVERGLATASREVVEAPGVTTVLRAPAFFEAMQTWGVVP